MLYFPENSIGIANAHMCLSLAPKRRKSCGVGKPRHQRVRRAVEPVCENVFWRLGSAIAGLVAGLYLAGPAQANPPVRSVVDSRVSVHSAAGDGLLAVAVSHDWSKPLPGIARAVIFVHGYHRTAVGYFANAARLAPDNRTLVIAPQFLAPEDTAAHGLPDTVLRWQRDHWSDGGSAEGPVAMSSFEVIDSLLRTLANRALLPDLTTIVLAGFSGGGQFVQRYAAVGQGERLLTGGRIGLRYVVGSPSSYVYFGDERPWPEGGFGPFAGAAVCPQFNHWKYGFAGILPDYVAASLREGLTARERRYAGLDLIYLLGTADNDPNHSELDKSCAGEAQGPNRFSRGLAYFEQMRARDGAVLKQRLWQAPGAGHQPERVFASPCGRAALFDLQGCSEN